MNRFLPIIFLLSILFNIGCVLVFRLRLDRRYLQRFKEYSENTTKLIADMSADSMSRIDSYFVSNYVSRSSHANDINQLSPFYTNVLDWDYDFSIVDGYPFAVRGSSYYTVGDRFPRGGVITAVTEDCIILDNLYSVNNSKSNNKLGDIKNEFRFDKVRQ